MYGTQTIYIVTMSQVKFENDVKMYGTQTGEAAIFTVLWFENDVKMYGTQTFPRKLQTRLCLRMM